MLNTENMSTEIQFEYAFMLKNRAIFHEIL